MNKVKAQESLRLLGRSFPEDAVEVGIRKDCAYLKIDGDERWSVAWTPGDRWFSVDTDAGYSLNYFDEGAPDREVLGILRFHVDVAAAYVRGDYVTKCSRILRVPELHIIVEGGSAVLTMSLCASLRYALRRARACSEVLDSHGRNTDGNGRSK